MNLSAWQNRLASLPVSTRTEVWPDVEHHPGFEPYSQRCRNPVLQLMEKLSAVLVDGHAAWLVSNRNSLEASANRPLAITFVIAAAFADLKFSPQESEMLTLLLRLPGAAAHALEQHGFGFRNFPFFSLELENDPGVTRTMDQM